MTLSDKAFAELRAEWNEAVPRLWAGEPDRTDFMIPICMAIGAVKTITVQEIIAMVAKELNTSARMISGKCQTKEACRARSLVALIAESLRSYHTPKEFAFMLGKDRNTVANSLEAGRTLLRVSSVYRAAYNTIRAEIGYEAELA